MNYLLDDHDDIPAAAQREFTLSTGSILALFFGLVLLCGLFFGFGYSVGSRRSSPMVAAQTTENAPAANFSAFKPAAGVAVGAANTIAVPHSTAVAAGALPSPTTKTTGSDASAATPPSRTPAAAPPAAAPIVRVAPAPAPAAASPATGSYYLVQVAAVSHQQDANLLVNALRARGYAAIAYPQQDNLIHIQVGPINNRHDAELMRQRLVTDGYNPIIK